MFDNAILVKNVNEIDKKIVIELFSAHKKVDISFDSFIQGKMGELWTNDLSEPSIAALRQGSFITFAGNAEHPKATEMIEKLPGRTCVMPSPEEWMNLLLKVHGDTLKRRERHSFTSETLNKAHLEGLSLNYAKHVKVRKISTVIVDTIFGTEKHKFHFTNYESVEDFVLNGLGFCAFYDDEIVCVASAALVTKESIEMNLLTIPNFRKQGIAIKVCATLILECLRNRKEPHWDAANTASSNLAKKLGFNYSDSYYVYVI